MTFSYPSRPGHPVLSHFTLTIPPGKSMALVGPSGCGKSTVVQLLSRFYDVDSGSITFDGVDIRDMDVKELRSMIGCVAQEPVLFSGSIRDNIQLGLGGVTDIKEGEKESRMVEASVMSNAHGFVEGFPDGYDTECGESNSTQMSGGQVRQTTTLFPRFTMISLILSVFSTRTPRRGRGCA